MAKSLRYAGQCPAHCASVSTSLREVLVIVQHIAPKPTQVHKHFMSYLVRMLFIQTVGTQRDDGRFVRVIIVQ